MEENNESCQKCGCDDDPNGMIGYDGDYLCPDCYFEAVCEDGE